MKSILLTLLISVLVFQNSSSLFGQERPKVGVVLSGGGAKGLAHIGVLKTLEEYGIKVDYIAGTSIGAIVGGLYACGYNASQLDSIVRNVNITDIILGEVSRSNTEIRTKKYDEKTALTLTFDRGRLNIPSALSNGQQVFDFIFKNTYPYVEMDNFGALPIPFFCIGTDLITGEEIMLNKGNLPLSMRASSSLPTVLSPVNLDGKIIVDGGVVNNLPAKELRKAGADIIIGVSVESGLFKEEDLTSATNILAQVSSYEIVKKSKEQSEECDILIKPEVAAYGLLNFGASDSIILRGQEACQPYTKQLIKIAKAQGLGKSYINQKRKPRRKYFKLLKIDINAENEKDHKYIESYLPFKSGDFLKIGALTDGIARLHNSDYFEFVEYNLIERGDGMILKLNPVVKLNYQNTFGTAIHYDDFYKASLLIQAKRKDFFIEQDQLQLDLVIGNRIRYDLDYHINRGALLSPGFHSRFQNNNVNVKLNNPLVVDSIFTIDELVFQYTDFSNEINIATLKRKNAIIEVATGLTRFKIDSDQLEVGMDQNFRVDDSWYVNLEGRYYYDDFNDRQFPMTGTLLKSKANLIKPIHQSLDLTQDGFSINLGVDMTHYHQITDRFSAGFDLVAGLTLFESYSLSTYNFGSASQNLINNFRPLPGLSFGQAVGSNALKISPLLRYKIGKQIFVTGQLNALWIGQSTDVILTSKNQVLGASLGIGYSSILGPIEFIYGIAEEEGDFFVNVGYWF